MVTRCESRPKGVDLPLFRDDERVVRAHIDCFDDAGFRYCSLPQLRLMAVKPVPNARFLRLSFGQVVNWLVAELAVIVLPPREHIAVLCFCTAMHSTNRDMIDAFTTQHEELHWIHKVFVATFISFAIALTASVCHWVSIIPALAVIPTVVSIIVI